MIFISALLLGFLGSVHCVGMCGPIVIAIPIKSQSNFRVLLNGITYNVGRVISYSIFGLLFGIVGESLTLVVLQSNLSIALGSIILIYLVLPKKIKSKIKSKGKISIHLSKLKSRMGKQLTRTTFSGSIILGVLNGLLPCGLVYAALAGAIATGSIIYSISYMALFGLGTIPAMLFLFYFKNQIDLQIRQKINKIIPYGIAFVAILMILRGLNLGIPMLSPDFSNNNKSGVIEADCEPSKVIRK